MKNLIHSIIDIFKNMILITFILFGYYNYYQSYSYKKNNPEMFDIKYVNKPTKEEIYLILDQIVNNNKGDCGESFNNKGYPFDSITLSRCYYDLKLLNIFIKNMEKIGFNRVILDEKEYYCLDQTQANIEILTDDNKIDYIYLNLSWSQDDICRKLNVKEILNNSK